MMIPVNTSHLPEAAQAVQTGHLFPDVSSYTPDNPLVIRAFGLDWDGTVTRSYKTLSAIHNALDAVDLDPKEFADRERLEKKTNFQRLLHDTKYGRDAVREFAAFKGVATIPRAVMDTMKTEQHASFVPYDGVLEVLRLAHEAGTFVFSYTNSAAPYTLDRLHRAGERHGMNPDHIDVIWAKYEEDLETIRPTPVTPFTRKLIGYDPNVDYVKPHPAPFHEVCSTTEAAPNETLFVGEGGNDFNCTFHDPKNPVAVFAFQRQGANDICGNQARMNDYLRPNNEPLGVHAVESRIEALGVQDKVIDMPNGFGTLLDMIEKRTLVFSRPKFTPAVRVVNNKHRLTYAY